MKRPKILMLLDNPFVSDSRVEKEAYTLSNEGFDVVVYALNTDELPRSEHRNGFEIIREIDPRIKSPLNRKYKGLLSKLLQYIDLSDVIAIHCHDYFLLEFATLLDKKNPTSKLIYDSHEYLKGWPYYKEIPEFINRQKGRVVWQKLLKNEAKFIQNVDFLIAPSTQIKNQLVADHKLKCESVAVRNIPLNEKKSKRNLKELLGVGSNCKILVHSGSVYMPNDFIESLSSFVSTEENWHLLFIGNRPIHVRLKEKFKGNNHVSIIDYRDDFLIEDLSQCDIGIAYTANSKYLAHKIGSSNRIMDYSLAQIPILATDQVTHTEMLEQFGHIEIFDSLDFSSFKQGFETIKSNHLAFKKKAELCPENLSWKTEFQPVIDYYKSLAKSDE